MPDRPFSTIGPASVQDASWLTQEIAAAEARIAELEREVEWRAEQGQALAADSARGKIDAERATLDRLLADRERLEADRDHARDLLLSTRRAAHLARQAYESWMMREYFTAAALLIAGRQLELVWMQSNSAFENAAASIFGTSDPEQRAAKARALFGDDAEAAEITEPPVSLVLAVGRKPQLLLQTLTLPAVATLHQLAESTPPDQVPAPICEPTG